MGLGFTNGSLSSSTNAELDCATVNVGNVAAFFFFVEVVVVVVNGTVVDVVVVVAPYGVEKLKAELVTDRPRSSVTTIAIVWFPPSRDRKSKYVDNEVN